MTTQVLRERNGKLLGKIEEVHGRLRLRDATGRLKGEYDPKSDTTRDDLGKLIGKGNLLTTLL